MRKSPISSAPSDIPQDWLLTNEQMAAARDRVNDKAADSIGAQVGTKRLLSHAVFTPGQPGWLDHVDAALAFKPDSMKGYTIGDNTHKDLSPQQAWDYRAPTVPLKVGWLQPDDISPVAVFLASDAANMVTGAEYEVKAGATLSAWVRF
jgi:hypothetical protein